MLFLQLLLTALAGGGTYLILADFVTLPSLRAARLYRGGGKKQKGGIIDRLCAPLAKRLEPVLMLNEYKAEKLRHTLQTIGDGRSAARYTADAAAQAVFVGALGLVTVFVNPLLPVLFLVLAVVAYLREMKAPGKKLALKRGRIERELPRFASTISNSLTASRDVVKILENYRKVCGAELADELDVTLADMKTGNGQDALRGLENRIGSTKLSELVRGLLSVLRGEDQTLYFYTKNVEFRREHMEYQKQDIQKRPEALLPHIILIIVCFMAMLLYILGYQIMAGQNKFI